MQISIRDRQDLLDSETRDFARRRILFALSRFDSRIDRVNAMVTDTNGPRGGFDKRCVITVQLKRLPDVRVTSDDSHYEKSIARAAERVGRAVERALGRSRQLARRRPHLT